MNTVETRAIVSIVVRKSTFGTVSAMTVCNATAARNYRRIKGVRERIWVKVGGAGLASRFFGGGLTIVNARLRRRPNAPSSSTAVLSVSNETTVSKYSGVNAFST